MSDATQIIIDVCYCLAGGCVGFFLGLVYSKATNQRLREVNESDE